MINPLVNSLNKSGTLKITAMTKQLIKEGKDVINFAAGEPDFDTPQFVKDQAKQAIDQGFTKYTPSTGIQELKQAIALKFSQENNIVCESNNVIVTPGAKYAIYAAMQTLLKTKDEVLIPSPYWVSYPEMAKLIGAKPKFLKTTKKDNFKIDINRLTKAISPRVKMLILNYPSNPTGVTYGKEELLKINEVVQAKNIYVLSDEIYEKLLYDGRRHVSFASLPQAAEKTITINGFSKAFSMTGWRLGYMTAPKTIIEAVSKVIDHTTSCASSISQAAGLAALKDCNWQETLRKEFEPRRDMLYNGLCKCRKIKPIKSEGTFYMFCDIRKTGLNSYDFTTKLLNEYLVSLIPGSEFGIEGFVRISFATAMENIAKGVERLKKFELGL